VKPPLVRVVCAVHKGHTVGQVLADPGGPEWHWELPLGYIAALAYAGRGDSGRPDRRFWHRRIPLARADEQLPAWCKKCRAKKWVEVTRLREIMAEGSPRRVLTV
jgi:hypothetical protein